MTRILRPRSLKLRASGSLDSHPSALGFRCGHPSPLTRILRLSGPPPAIDSPCPRVGLSPPGPSSAVSRGPTGSLPLLIDLACNVGLPNSTRPDGVLWSAGVVHFRLASTVLTVRCPTRSYACSGLWGRPARQFNYRTLVVIFRRLAPKRRRPRRPAAVRTVNYALIAGSGADTPPSAI